MKNNLLSSQYVKDIEKYNGELDDRNCKLNNENEKLKEQLKQLTGANEELSSCLSVLMERHTQDRETVKIIMNALNSVAKKLNGKKY